MILYKSQYHSPIGKSVLLPAPKVLIINNPKLNDFIGLNINAEPGQNYSSWQAMLDPINLIGDQTLNTIFYGSYKSGQLKAKLQGKFNINEINPNQIDINFDNDFIPESFTITGKIGQQVSQSFSYQGVGFHGEWIPLLSAVSNGGANYTLSSFGITKALVIVPGGTTTIKLTYNFNSIDLNKHPNVISFTTFQSENFLADNISIEFDYIIPNFDPIPDDYNLVQVQILGMNLMEFHILDYIIATPKPDDDKPHHHHHHHHQNHELVDDDYDDDCECDNHYHTNKSTTTTTTTTTTVTTTTVNH